MRHIKKNIVIGLTGGIATGKSTVSEMLRKSGCIIISADKIYHTLIKPKNICWTNIVKHFGDEILNDDRTINRKKLGDMVFSNKRKLKELNKITHPYVLMEIKKTLQRLRNKNKIVVLEVPLLIESNASKLVDKIIVVKTNKKNQISRLLENKGINRMKAKKIIGSQMPMSKKIKYADYVIDNNSTLINTKKQVKLLYKSFEKILSNMI